MLQEIINIHMSEIAALEAKTQRALNMAGSFALSKDSPLRKSENRLWLPILCLTAAKAAKEINYKAYQLAGLLHLFNYATYLHFSIADEQQTSCFRQEVQYPVLVGDLLYCMMCEEISRDGLQQYLDLFTVLISGVHQELAQRDLTQGQGFISGLHQLDYFAVLSETACYLGSHAVLGNNFMTEIQGNLGYELGGLRAAYEKDTVTEAEKTSWSRAWALTGFLPNGSGRKIFREILFQLWAKWQPSLPEETRMINA